MKTTIYELLGMIKDNKAPKKIQFNYKIYEYYENDDYIDYRTYESDVDGYGYLSTYIEFNGFNSLNDEVEILETTITYKPDKIEKLKFDMSINFIDQFTDKINEIIDHINED